MVPDTSLDISPVEGRCCLWVIDRRSPFYHSSGATLPVCTPSLFAPEGWYTSSLSDQGIECWGSRFIVPLAHSITSPSTFWLACRYSKQSIIRTAIDDIPLFRD